MHAYQILFLFGKCVFRQENLSCKSKNKSNVKFWLLFPQTSVKDMSIRTGRERMSMRTARESFMEKEQIVNQLGVNEAL